MRQTVEMNRVQYGSAGSWLRVAWLAMVMSTLGFCLLPWKHQSMETMAADKGSSSVVKEVLVPAQGQTAVRTQQTDLLPAGTTHLTVL